MSDFGRRITVLGLSLGLPALGCGGSDGGNGGTPPSTTAIAKSSNSGDAQSGVVGQPLADSLRVIVTQDGAPSAGATVTWSTTAQAGSMSPPSAVTDANGVAASLWTLGHTSGAQSARAAVSGASGSPVNFSATAAADAPASLSALSGDQQTGDINTALAQPVVAKVSDQFGNGVSNLDVAWTATNATVSAPVVATDGSGASAVNVTLGGTAGPITITATSNDLTGASLAGSPVTFTATAETPPPPGTTVLVVNNSFQPSTLTVSAGTTVTWSWAASAQDHNVRPVGTEPSRSGNPRDGPATYQFTFNTPGTYAYYCEVHGSPTFGMRGTIVVQ